MTQDNEPGQGREPGATDGLGGTDSGSPPGAPPSNVLPLFTDRLTGAGIPPQPDVILVLQNLLADAEAGRLVGLAVIGFMQDEGYISGNAGKLEYISTIGALETLKHHVMMNLRPPARPRPGSQP